MLIEECASQSLQVAGFGCIRNGRVLLRNIDLSLNAGQVLLLKGGNGAGKSTLLRSIAGLMTWRAGELRWCGQQVQAGSPSFQQHLSYLGHQCGMNDALTGLENLRFALDMQSVTWRAEHVADVLRELGVEKVAHRPVAGLSQGQRRRLGIARVMLSERTIWLLDEPDNALDAHGCSLLAYVLANHAKHGGLAMAVSHRGIYVPEAPNLILDLSAVAPKVLVMGNEC